MDYQRYHELREDESSLFGYGLLRRYAKLEEAFQSILTKHSGAVRIVDFGCADGFMLEQLVARFPKQIESSHGFDLFVDGVPEPAHKISFTPVNLFYQYPYPLPEQSIDICYASAFFKHHPRPKDFLVEVTRILKPAGKLLLSDPCSATVKVGQWVGYFDRKWMPNRWSNASLKLVLGSNPELAELSLTGYERYWFAPTKKLFDAGMEQWLPARLRRLIGLHQFAVLEKHSRRSPEVQPEPG